MTPAQLFLRPLAALLVLVVLTRGVEAGSPANGSHAASGQAVYEHWCAPCHASGLGHPGTQSLQLKYGGKLPAVLLERTDLPAQTVAMFVRQGVLLMAPFRKTEITDTELAALSAYVARNFKSAAAPR
ncbi:MAG TPA: cytochrome c [Steroidobacteraceae bacterium]|nr:cytochrome c [Steroidobacteraceae bacterium]